MMSKKYTDGATIDGTSGFSLLELLVVMVLITLILGVTLPSITVSKDEAFPAILNRAFRYAVLTALTEGRSVTIELAKSRIKVLGRTWTYPKGIEPDEPTEVLVRRTGSTAPVELVFFEGNREFKIRLGLFGIDTT